MLVGDNGQGKTSVLEAIYFAATSRSFRTERISEVVQEGCDKTIVEIQLSDDGYAREQRATVNGTRRQMLMDGQKPSTLAAYATRSPVVVFHPGDLNLVAGAASGRRTLLDRLALFANPLSSTHRGRYRHALRERQAILERQKSSAVELEAFETLMAQDGSAITRLRHEACQLLSNALQSTFGRTASPQLNLVVRYAPGGTEDSEAFARELESRRGSDARRKLATFGPQRDDIEFFIDGRSVRRHASQGQQRILALAIKLAELECIGRIRQAHPILLLDDISSELDSSRAGAVYGYLQESPSQIFVTTTRPELFVTPGVEATERFDFRLVNGAVFPP